MTSSISIQSAVPCGYWLSPGNPLDQYAIRLTRKRKLFGSRIHQLLLFMPWWRPWSCLNAKN